MNCTPPFIPFWLHYIPITAIDSIDGDLTNMAILMTEDSQYLSREGMMRSHYLWPWKSQNCTISVNLEAIWTTMIASKLFQPLYVGYSWVLHYIIDSLWLSNFDISLAFTYDWHPRTYLLSSNISSRSQITCNRCNPVQEQPHMTSGFNCSMFLAFYWSLGQSKV